MKTVLFFIAQERYCFSEQLEGFCQYARKANWHVQVAERPKDNRRMREILDVWRPSGAFVEYGDRRDLVDRRLFAKVPVVYFDIGRVKPVRGHFMSFDSAAAGRIGAAHLIRLDCESYAYVGHWERTVWDVERREAFEREIRATGRPFAAFQQTSDLRAADRHLSLSKWLKRLPRPCGVLAANDRVAEEVLSACQRLHIPVPDDFAVMGVDNDRTVCENVSPTLSTVVPCTLQEGYCAAEWLDRLMNEPCDDTCLEVRRVPPQKVLERQSTRRPAGGHREILAALECIRKNACAGMTVSDVVAVLGGSRRNAERHFRQATGRSIQEEITRVRFERVYELLENPNCALGAIAGQAGYSTEVALRKAFRQCEGCSMSEWRRKHLPSMTGLSQKYR